MEDLIKFIARAVKSQFTGKIELNFIKGNFKINYSRTNVEAHELISLAI